MADFRQLRLSSVANHVSLRCDAKYRLFWGINGGMLFPDATVDCHPFKHALVPVATRLVPKGELADDVELVELEDVEQRTGVVLASNITDNLNSTKLMFGGADVLTTRLRPNLGKTFLNDSARRLAGSTEWIPLKLNQQRLHPALAKYYLLSSQYVDHAERLLSGKEHPRVADSDIAALRVPFPSRLVQENLVARIQVLEKQQAAERDSLRDPINVINDFLCTEFRYPLREHQERARRRHYAETLAGVARGYMLRSSAKFHHPDFELTEQFFSRTPHVRVKALVVVPIRLGATASKGDFVEDGAAYYVHPGATKRQTEIALEDCYQVIEEFYESARRRFNLRMNDIVLNRAGEGTIGKSGLWTSEEPALFSDFTMRLRLTEHVNVRFVWYFLRSVMFQAQIEREKRGMGNMTNIFPPEVERMLIVACDPARQNSIARTIDEELARLDALRTGIEAKRQEIDRLIDDAVRGAGAHS